MTEETHNAAVAGPIGIIMAVGVSAVLGWFLILGLLFSIQDLPGTVNSATGEPVPQIIFDTVGEKGAIVLMVSIDRPSPFYYDRDSVHCALAYTGRHYRLHVLLRYILHHVQ